MNHGAELNMPPSSCRSWETAAAKLASIITRPMHVASICVEASSEWGWEQTFTVNVLAAGEKKSFISGLDGKWSRAPGARVEPTAKVNGQLVGYGVNFKICKQCDVEFVPRSQRQMYCHHNCRQLSWAAARKNRPTIGDPPPYRSLS